MTRVKTTKARLKRKRRMLKKAKGFRGARRKLYRTALESVRRSMAFSYRDRRVKKRTFRSLWIVRINAACRAHNITYSKFIKGLKSAKVNIDRKILADIAVNNKKIFAELVTLAKGENK